MALDIGQTEITLKHCNCAYVRVCTCDWYPGSFPELISLARLDKDLYVFIVKNNVAFPQTSLASYSQAECTTVECPISSYPWIKNTCILFDVSPWDVFLISSQLFLTEVVFPLEYAGHIF